MFVLLRYVYFTYWRISGNALSLRLHCVNGVAGVNGFRKFLSDDAGAVTIDWVALTAGVLMVGVIVVYAIYNDGVSSLVDNLDDLLTGISVEQNLGTVTIGDSTINAGG